MHCNCAVPHSVDYEQPNRIRGRRTTSEIGDICAITTAFKRAEAMLAVPQRSDVAMRLLYRRPRMMSALPSEGAAIQRILSYTEISRAVWPSICCCRTKRDGANRLLASASHRNTSNTCRQPNDAISKRLVVRDGGYVGLDHVGIG